MNLDFETEKLILNIDEYINYMQQLKFWGLIIVTIDAKIIYDINI